MIPEAKLSSVRGDERERLEDFVDKAIKLAKENDLTFLDFEYCLILAKSKSEKLRYETKM